MTLGLASVSAAQSSPTAAGTRGSATAQQSSDARLASSVVAARHRTKAHAKKRKAHRSGHRPSGWSRRTVRAVGGRNKITLTWPARARATMYTVTWSPTSKAVPSSLSQCHWPCRYRTTRHTSMTLTTRDLSTHGHVVSSASGNHLRFKIFARNSRGSTPTGVTYPHDSWIGPSRNANVNWLPTVGSAMPAPLPAANGRSVAVSSFNVLTAGGGTRVVSWRTRAPKVVAQINATHSSIVATQEASNSASGVGAGASTNQYEDLANRLRPSGWALSDGRNWDYEIGLHHSDSTQAVRIFYRSSVWQQVGSGAFRTSVRWGRATSGHNVHRWVSWSKLRMNSDPSTQVCVVDAHLLTNQGYYDRASANHRQAEISQIWSQIRGAGGLSRVGANVGQYCAGTPMVFAGDLNADQEHAPYGNLPQAGMVGAGFVDTLNAPLRVYTRLSGTGPVGTWHAHWGTRIDYVLTRGMGGAVSFKVTAASPSAQGSDHFPITAVVRVPRS